MTDPDNERFSVNQFLNDDKITECVGHDLDAETAVKLAHSYTTRPAAMLGFISRVRIFGEDDACVFEWVKGKGVTFPTKEQRANA